MTAHAFVLLTDGLLVDLYGSDAVEEWRTSTVVDEVAQRRKENALAALMVGGEVG